MIEKFRPDKYQKTIFDINYPKLKKDGIKCLVFDLNNTIVDYKQNKPTNKEYELFQRLEELEFKTLIISNANKKRVRLFKDSLNIDSSYHAFKPFKKKYKKIMNIYQFNDNEIACIGDNLLTDVLGANRMGFISILVTPISKNEPFSRKILRFFERRVFKKLKKRGLLEKGDYYE